MGSHRVPWDVLDALLRQDDASIVELSRLHGVNQGTLRERCRKLGLPPRKPGPRAKGVLRGEELQGVKELREARKRVEETWAALKRLLEE